MRVSMGMRVGASVRRRVVVRRVVLGLGHDLDAAVGDAAGGEDAIGHPFQLVAAALQDDDLEAAALVEVHVQRRAHLFAPAGAGGPRPACSS